MNGCEVIIRHVAQIGGHKIVQVQGNEHLHLVRSGGGRGEGMN